MRACELAALLAQDAESVAQLLLPNGRRDGREWVCGDVDGSAGHSLKIVIQGSKAGVWRDFATDDGGDLVGLWMATRHVDLKTACQEISRHLGIVETKLEPPRRVYSKPTREGVHAVGEPLLSWLKTVRKLTDRSIGAYKVASKKGAVMFPYLRDGELIFAKYRAAPEKKFWTDADCEPCLFGWQAVPADARAVALVEGELDALALFEYGIPALSVPFGGGKGDKQAWIEHEFDRLAIFDTLYLALDQDATGEQAVQEIVSRLGRERCKVVRLPRKDANACLIDGVPAADIETAFAASRTLDPPRLRDSGEFEEAVLREFEIGRHGDPGIRLPWRKVGDRLVLRPGEVSIWAGINGHGKSEVVGHIALDATLDDYRVCCASLEFRPEKWLKRMVRQAAGTAVPTPAHIRHIMQAIRGRLWVYNCTGAAKTAEMLEVFAYATKRYGVRLFVIDNLAKCGFAEDDYNGQKGFVDALSDLAREHNVHVMIVAHTKKTDKGEDKPPEKHDIKGTGALTDMADTVVTVWRNKVKERRIATGEASHGALQTDPDCVLVCSKQRNGEDEPRILLWFDKASHQYLEEPGSVAMPLLGIQSVGGSA